MEHRPGKLNLVKGCSRPVVVRMHDYMYGNHAQVQLYVSRERVVSNLHRSGTLRATGYNRWVYVIKIKYCTMIVLKATPSLRVASKFYTRDLSRGGYRNFLRGGHG